MKFWILPGARFCYIHGANMVDQVSGVNLDSGFLLLARKSTKAKLMAGAKKKADETGEIVSICKNRRAFHEYDISDTLECGLVLTGTEVKSLRDGYGSIDDAYAKIEGGEVWLIGSDIPEYVMANRYNHKPKRARKLLLHKREIGKFAGKASERGYTLIPLAMYFKDGRAKVEISVARGKKQFDKRADQKKAEVKKALSQAMKRKR